jgi:2-hydroxy-6-oxonona-2,4-dienedioate hydrolase
MRLTLETRRQPWDPAGGETRWTPGPHEGAFRVRVCRPDKTADGAVVLIHGVIVSGRYLTPLGAALSRDFAVAIPDLPGYGLSQSTIPGQTLAELADAAVASAAVLGTDRVSLVGNSFGAQIAIEAAVRHPETVQRIALIGPTTDPRARSLPRQYLRWQRCGPHEHPSVFPVMARDLLDVGPLQAARLLGVMLRDHPEDKLPVVRQPALVVRGEHDHVAPADWARYVARLLPDGRMTQIPSQGHMPHWSGAAEVASALRAFLS